MIIPNWLRCGLFGVLCGVWSTVAVAEGAIITAVVQGLENGTARPQILGRTLVTDAPPVAVGERISVRAVLRPDGRLQALQLRRRRPDSVVGCLLSGPVYRDQGGQFRVVGVRLDARSFPGFQPSDGTWVEARGRCSTNGLLAQSLETMATLRGSVNE